MSAESDALLKKIMDDAWNTAADKISALLLSVLITCAEKRPNRSLTEREIMFIFSEWRRVNLPNAG